MFMIADSGKKVSTSYIRDADSKWWPATLLRRLGSTQSDDRHACPMLMRKEEVEQNEWRDNSFVCFLVAGGVFHKTNRKKEGEERIGVVMG